MINKLVIVLLLSFMCYGVRATENQEDVALLLQRVDLVLFLLEKNTVRMERYGLHELQSDVNIVSKDLSAERSIFKISMTEEKSKARCISWDYSQEGRIKIIAGTKKISKTYYLMLKKIVNQEVCLENCTMMCFDCAISGYKSEAIDTLIDKQSIVEIVVPVGDEHVTMQLVFPGKIDDACGLFVQNELFRGSVPVVGILSREEAMNQGVLITQEMAQHAHDTFDKSVETSAAVNPQSTWSQFKDSFFNSLHKIKNFCGVSWQKILGYCGAR